jgi:hypothetical protein
VNVESVLDLRGCDESTRVIREGGDILGSGDGLVGRDDGADIIAPHSLVAASDRLAGNNIYG